MNIGERRIVLTAPASVELTALAGVPMVRPGDDLADIILASLAASDMSLRDGDVLVLAQKIVAKAQNRFIRLGDVVASPRAVRLAREVGKSPELVELILRESSEVVRSRRDVLIVAHKLGLVMANAGIDQSNVEQAGMGQDGVDDTVLLLPEDPDGTCAELCEALFAATGAAVGVVISDSHGRAFRNGTVGVAIGVAGVEALADLRGSPDLYSRRLQSTEVGLADEIASAASLLMGQAAEGRPIVLLRGLTNAPGGGCAADLVRRKEIDLFRSPANADGLAFIRGRRSIRRYSDAPVADDAVERILDAAVSAPSAHNRQPWRFAVLKTASARKRLAQAMGARLREDRGRDGDPADDIETDIVRSVARIASAPVAILVCLAMEDMDRYPDRRRADAEYLMAVQSTAMAMQNIQLAAHALGLGAGIMCAPLFCQDAVRTVLDLPAAWEPQALITLGVPANSGKPFRRHALNDVIRVVD